MSSVSDTTGSPAADLERRGIRFGDVAFQGIAVAASAAATVLLGMIAWQVFDLAWPAIQEFGISFLWTNAWDPVKDVYGAAAFIYGQALGCAMR